MSSHQQQIASQLETEGVDDPAIQDKVQEALRALKPDEVDRLMYVGTLPNSCEFSRTSAKVKHYLEIDRQLNKTGLVEIKPDPAAYKQVKKDGRSRKWPAHLLLSNDTHRARVQRKDSTRQDVGGHIQE